MKQLITRTRLAKLAGVTQAAITKACKNQLAGALDGKKIIENHPATIAYLESRGVVAPKQARGHKKIKDERKAQSLNTIETGSTLHQIPDDIQAFADMTLRELIQRFGTEYAFLDWLKATKQIEDINEKRLKNAQTAGDLVHRDLVKRGIIDPIDSAHLKLLTDGAKTMARRSKTLSDSGAEVEEIEKFICDQISSFIKPVKNKIKRILRDAGD